MKELKCPKCGSIFQVDESDYAAIMAQVKNQEFNKEVEHRVNEIENQKKTEREVYILKANQSYRENLNAKVQELVRKDAEISNLQEKLRGYENTKRLELDIELAKKDKEIQELKTVISNANANTEIAVLKEKEERL